MNPSGVDCKDIKTDWWPGTSTKPGGQEGLRSPAQAKLLGSADTCNRPAKLRAAAFAYLDNDQFGTVHHDQIQFANANAVIALEQTQAARKQIIERELLRRIAVALT